jgi:hypothetical protein
MLTSTKDGADTHAKVKETEREILAYLTHHKTP